MSYSQNDEELHLIAYLNPTERPERPGRRFLDIGAHNGVTFSNTRRLAELGWGGTLVEPSSAAFKDLMNVYQDRSDVSLANIAIVTAPPRILKFYDSRGDFISTFDEAHRKRWAAHGANFQPIYVAAVTMADLLKAFPGPYAFVNLDVEGINYDLFVDLPLQELETELVCVEYQEKLREIEAHAAKQGYRRLHTTGENVLLVRR